MRQKSQVTEAIVLKRTNVGEADRIVTLLTREYGKIACVAKGVRKITSGRKASLEPGNHVKILLISTKSMSLLTQATLIDDCSSVRHSLPKLRQLLQVLEMVDHLCVEGETEQELFDQVLEIRALVVQSQPTPGIIRRKLDELLSLLGYDSSQTYQHLGIMEYVSQIADRPMHAWEYLKV